MDPWDVYVYICKLYRVFMVFLSVSPIHFTLNKPLPRGFRRFFVNIDVPRDKVTHVTWVRDVDVELSVTRLSIRIHRQSITLR